MQRLTPENKETIVHNLKTYIDEKCIFRADPEVTYFEGLPKGKLHGSNPTKLNTHLFVMRNLTHNPVMMNAVSVLFLDWLIGLMKDGEEYNRFQFAGLETSSTPVMIALQSNCLQFGIQINSLNIRRERKNYGLHNIIDGIPEKDCPVMFVDDIFSSGRSVIQAYTQCSYELGLTPAKNMFTIVNKNPDGSKTLRVEGQDINIESLFMSDDFNFDYDPEKYWFPEDCTLDTNKRPEYQ